MFLKKTAKMIILLITVALVSQKTFAAGDMTNKDACYKGMELYITAQFKKAMGVFKQAAKKKNACAQFQIGMMYYYGHGVKKSNKNAKAWLKKSSDNGLKKSVTQIGLIK